MDDIELHSKQIEAINTCTNVSNRIVAITGAAGTGKTTIIRKIAKHFEDTGNSFAICAPTGKAARRITQATGYDAVTIHKLLEYPKPGERDPKTGKALDTGYPKRNYQNPLEKRVIICDEYAMVGTELDRNIIDALSSGARLVVFGDNNQLPPIEKYVIKNNDGKTPFQRHLERCSVELEVVFRQDEDGGILSNATRICKGQLPKKTTDFDMKITDKQTKALQEFLLSCMDKDIFYNTLTNQIITPQKKSWVGTHALNRMLRDLYNPHPDNIMTLPRHSWDEDMQVSVGIGDKVVCTENMYDFRDFQERYEEWTPDGNPVDSSFIPVPDTKLMLNGETGIIRQISEDGDLEIELEDRTVEIPSVYNEWSIRKKGLIEVFPARNIDLAYALTTHKCQGSEYDRVIYMMTSSMFYMLNRKNFYTAVTRAKKFVTVISDQRGLSAGLNPYIDRRAK